MGMKLSKKLCNSQEFTSACAAAYEESLSTSQHAFSGIPRYQLLPSLLRLHSHLPTSILRWAPLPPTQSQLDSALRRGRDVEMYDLVGFEGLGKEVYGEIVKGEMGKEVVKVGAVLGGVGAVGGMMRGRMEIGVFLALLAAGFLGLP